MRCYNERDILSGFSSSVGKSINKGAVFWDNNVKLVKATGTEVILVPDCLK